jgi:thermitase
MSGAAPDATVISFRVSDDPVLFDNGDLALAKCINFCVGLLKNGTDVAVISASLGGTNIGTEQAIKRALREAREAGIIIVAPGGQFFISRPKLFIPEDAGNPSFPGSSPDTICAAACEYDAEPLEGGFYGEEVDITAPGFNVWVPKSGSRSSLSSLSGSSSVLSGSSSSSSSGGGANSAPSSTESHVVIRSEGTSYATALTAAACALWQSFHGREFLLRKYKYGDGNKLFTAFKACLCCSADVPKGFDTSQRGAGILNVERLLDEKLPDPENLPHEPEAGCASILQSIRNPPILPRPQ